MSLRTVPRCVTEASRSRLHPLRTPIAFFAPASELHSLFDRARAGSPPLSSAHLCPCVDILLWLGCARVAILGISSSHTHPSDDFTLISPSIAVWRRVSCLELSCSSLCCTRFSRVSRIDFSNSQVSSATIIFDFGSSSTEVRSRLCRDQVTLCDPMLSQALSIC